MWKCLGGEVGIFRLQDAGQRLAKSLFGNERGVVFKEWPS